MHLAFYALVILGAINEKIFFRNFFSKNIKKFFFSKKIFFHHQVFFQKNLFEKKVFKKIVSNILQFCFFLNSFLIFFSKAYFYF